MTPSLLPRGPLFQGLVSGLAGATGYAIGVFAVWLVRFMLSRDSSPPAPRRAWLALIVVGAIGMVAMVIWFHVWQDRVRDLMGVKHLVWLDYPLTTALSLVVLFGVVEAGQLIRRLVHFLDLRLDRFAPPRVSAVIVVLLLVALTIALLNGVVVKFAMRTMNNTFATVNNEVNPEQRRAADTAAVRGPAVAGDLGIAGTPGPHLRQGRAHRRPAHRVQRRAGDRADPRLRRTRLRRRHHRGRGVGGARIGARRADYAALSSRSEPPPAPAGSTRPRPTHWSTCTTATPQW